MRLRDGHFAIVDLNSSNGVLVNGKRIRRHTLRSGDTVQLSPYDIKLLAASRANASAALTDARKR